MAKRVSNWGRNHSCQPARVERPTSEAEVVAAVQRAAVEQLTIKCVGAAHSWSDAAMTDGVLLSLDAMQGFLELDEARGLARVQAGIRLHQLNEALAERGFALPILGSMAEQSLAGATATGTHGSSLVHGNLSSLIRGMRLVTGRGDVVVLATGDPRLDAARVGLGALGIVTELTIAVQPAFRLCEQTEAIPLAQALGELPGIARSAEYVKLWWLPHTDAVIVFRYERTDAPSTFSPFARWLDEHVVNRWLFALLLGLGRLLPALVPRFNKLVAATYLKPRRTVGRSDRMLTLAMPPVHRETEASVPLRHAAEALRRAAALIDEQGLKVNFVTEVRFVKADDGWMSPAGGRDSCQLGAYMAQAPGVDAWLQGFQDAVADLDARPHWGKELSRSAGRLTAEQVAAAYPRSPEFWALVREWDPDRRFVNAFVERIRPPA